MPMIARGPDMQRHREAARLLFAASLLLAAAQAKAQDAVDSESTTDLAKKLQNPIGDLYSFPFQSNTNFNYGPNKGTQENLNIQPVIPIHVTPEWNIITRTILPLIWQPSLEPMHTVPFGTGPTTFSAFLSPATPKNGWLWGAGPAIQIPTISDKTLGSNVWGGGPTGVLVYMKGPVVTGAIANNIWSFGGTSGSGGTKYNNFLIQPFFNYNFGAGWYATTAPIITANWEATGNNAWTLPIGGGFGRVVKLGGKLPVNLGLSAYANVLRPKYGATWQLRAQATLIF
ncbi:MAG TPA: hypothetical protein VMH92_10795 [Acidocella sp.]|nr:hypothetical protein [Acidocella sp.]